MEDKLDQILEQLKLINKNLEFLRFSSVGPTMPLAGPNSTGKLDVKAKIEAARREAESKINGLRNK